MYKPGVEWLGHLEHHSSLTATHERWVILSEGRVCAEADAELLFQSQCEEAMAAAELCADPNFPKYLIAGCGLPIAVC